MGVTLLIAVAAYHFFLTHPRQAPRVYTASGSYTFQTYPLPSPGAPPPWTNNGKFTVQVDHDKWAISLQPDPVRTIQGPVVTYRHHLATFDGQTIYAFEAPEVSFDDPNDPRMAGGSSYRGTAQMENGPIPQRLDQGVQAIWLGLASGGFFGQRSPGYHPRLGLPPEDPQRHDNFRLVYVDWLPQPMEPHIPAWVAYKGAEADSGLGKGEKMDYTNLWFHVSSWTNRDALSIPRDFEVSTFFDTTLPVTTMHCSVTSVVPGTTAVEFVPRLDRPTSILDRRLTNGPPYGAVRHGLTNGWPSLQATAVIDARARARGFQTGPATQPPPR